MRFHSPEPQSAGFQLAPMIDIVFLLLIFFIVEWKYTQDETEIEIVSRDVLSHDQLQTKLANIVRVHKNQPVRIRGDKETDFQTIVQVLDTCRKAGIWNVSFATKAQETN